MKGREIAGRERDVQRLHPRIVIEIAGADLGAHGPRHPPVERREISGAARVGDAPGHDLIHLQQDLVDRIGGRGG